MVQVHSSAEQTPKNLTCEPLHQAHSFNLSNTIAFQKLSCLAEKTLKNVLYTQGRCCKGYLLS